MAKLFKGKSIETSEEIVSETAIIYTDGYCQEHIKLFANGEYKEIEPNTFSYKILTKETNNKLI